MNCDKKGETPLDDIRQNLSWKFYGFYFKTKEVSSNPRNEIVERITYRVTVWRIRSKLVFWTSLRDKLILTENFGIVIYVLLYLFFLRVPVHS